MDLKLVFVSIVIPLLYVTDGWVMKERFFLLLFIYSVSSVGHLIIYSYKFVILAEVAHKYKFLYYGAVAVLPYVMAICS